MVPVRLREKGVCSTRKVEKHWFKRLSYFIYHAGGTGWTSIYLDTMDEDVVENSVGL